MKLIYDKRDIPIAAKLKDSRLEWLQGLGAAELSDVGPNDSGFLFGYAHSDDRLSEQVGRLPNVHDRQEERQELICLDDVLARLHQRDIKIPAPKTWILELDCDLPNDLVFPLFVRTPKSSWKRGGEQGKVNNPRELTEEMELLRRAFGWDVRILVRQWLDLPAAGQWMFGDAPQEIRVWVVDHCPLAWSFHYLHAIPKPKSFPPTNTDLGTIKEYAGKIASAFQSLLIVVDFVRDIQGSWNFLEAGPGAIAGTAHQEVFEFVASALIGKNTGLEGDDVGGPL